MRRKLARECDAEHQVVPLLDLSFTVVRSRKRMPLAVFFLKLFLLCSSFRPCRPAAGRIRQDTPEPLPPEVRLTPHPPLEKFDVLVYGANAAGVGAAVTASSGGRFRVKVVEPLRMIGGMAAAGGVSLMNQGGCGLTGLAKNWSILVGQYYGLTDGMPYPPSPRMKESELGFWKLLNSSVSIDTRTGCHVVAVAVDHRSEYPNSKNAIAAGQMSSRSIGSIRTVQFKCDDGEDFSVDATYVIDASYDGDIMVMAGVDHTSGREARSVYNESLAGVLSAKEWSDLESFSGQHMKTVDPYDDNGDVLKYINPNPLDADGSADDDGLMAFQFLACLSATPGNMVPFYAPEGYNADDFLLLLRQTEAVMENGMFPYGPPISYFGDLGQCYDSVVENRTGNRDCMFCCGTAPVDADQPDLNKGWAKASYEERLVIANKYRYYIQGSLFFMANDPRMPTATRTDAQMHGYCKDEYSDFGNFPPQLYVRISNRLLGQEFLTQNNISNPQMKSDGVAMGCWPFDQHTVTRRVVFDEAEGADVVRNEGFFRVPVGPGSDGNVNPFNDHWYDVPFGVMVPRNISQANNLLVPVTISVSSVAYSSARIENMFMDLGSAAGVAVALLLERRTGQAAKLGDAPRLSVQDDVIVADVQDVLNNTYGQKFHGTHNVVVATPTAEA